MAFKAPATEYIEEEVFDRKDKKQAKKYGQHVSVTSPVSMAVTFDEDKIQVERRTAFKGGFHTYGMNTVTEVRLFEDETGSGTLIGVHRSKVTNLFIVGTGWSEHVRAKSNYDKQRLTEFAAKLSAAVGRK